ncbi:response regulator transcription factor [Candidatus Vampirococcus lugosii]|uniref:DNA-binding response regulator, OmpR family, contains REC and winged-helix (WHTH) domain n=1 Tax=Candidatus Vampirococcus lugosii TaxID=2789015 RepID=A0ABS5QNA5_9BACT|nr:response regulator transcription factor [Candidatus Vampirococcus lugosii]MBS8121939.1 DNA-binding response regulator, OmpR family, contains REC and winged-helix (wHTH) domain [Candidatus Vampirococcus lugosii]
MKKTILIVEDNKELSEMFKIKFEKGGFNVFISDNGFDSLGLAIEKEPDLILLDIMMPDMDGFETLKVLKEQTSLKTKIFIFSNLKSDDHIKKAKKLGADDYLVKADYTPKEVLDKVILSIGPADDKKSIFCSDADKTFVSQCPHCGEKFKLDIKISKDE